MFCVLCEAKPYWNLLLSICLSIAGTFLDDHGHSGHFIWSLLERGNCEPSCSERITLFHVVVIEKRGVIFITEYSHVGSQMKGFD